jgi:hypothetical protein
MLHAFCLGPVEVDRGGSTFFGVAVVDGRMEPPVIGATVAACLKEMRRRHPEGPHLCDLSLQHDAIDVGFMPFPLPDDLVPVRAGLALTLAQGRTLAPAIPPSVVMELLAACGEFLASGPWQRIDSDEPLHAVIEGAVRGTWEASILGSAGRELGIGLYPTLGTHALVRASGGAPTPEVRKKFSTVAVTFDSHPEFAVEAIGAHIGADLVPSLMRMERGKNVPMKAQEVMVLAAALRAAAAPDRIGGATAPGIEVTVTLVPAQPVVQVLAPARKPQARARKR